VCSCQPSLSATVNVPATTGQLYPGRDRTTVSTYGRNAVRVKPALDDGTWDLRIWLALVTFTLVEASSIPPLL